jgi:hypothetical protein
MLVKGTERRGKEKGGNREGSISLDLCLHAHTVFFPFQCRQGFETKCNPLNLCCGILACLCSPVQSFGSLTQTQLLSLQP